MSSSPSPQAAPQRRNLLLPDQERWPLDASKPVIVLEDVSIAFGQNKVLDGLSLEILPGKTTVIVGRSGSGKSVLLKLMMGLLRPDRGRVVVFGKDLTTLNPQEIIALRKRMSMLFQNYALLDSLPIEENIAFPLIHNSDMPLGEILPLVHELMAILGLQGTERLLPSSLSGGMRKRVSLARALVANPEVVLFDEPTTGLDPIMIEKVDEMIVKTRQTYEITSVIISHDMASTSRLADRVAFLHDGRIVFGGSYDEFMHADLPPVQTFVEGASTSRLADVDDVGDEETTVERGVAAAPSSPAQAELETEANANAKTKLEPIVELVGVHKSFGTKHVLRDINLAIYPGEVTVLIGASGSGKSVIIKHIMGLFQPDEGEIRVFGQNIVGMVGRELDAVRARTGLLFQHAALLDWLTVAENVAFPVQERTDTPKREIRDMVSQILERLHISDIADSMPGEISEGQKKRVGLARAIIMKPEIMIYDEPTTGQDPIRTRQVDDMIQQAQDEFDITSIVISHDMASTFRIANRIALLHQGEIAAYGTPAELRASTSENVQKFIYAGKVG